ncbi:MAG: hypothetical protein ACRENE_01115 [Polyangiaceae bacterium]
MRISEGGLGAPLACVLGDVLWNLARGGGRVEVTVGELVALVRKTDRFTGKIHGARRREPVGPTPASIRRVLKKKRDEGAISMKTGPSGAQVILLHRRWRTEGGWEDRHDHTQCHCGSGDGCYEHDPDTFRSEHQTCGAPYPCQKIL